MTQSTLATALRRRFKKPEDALLALGLDAALLPRFRAEARRRLAHDAGERDTRQEEELVAREKSRSFMPPTKQAPDAAEKMRELLASKGLADDDVDELMDMMGMGDDEPEITEADRIEQHAQHGTASEESLREQARRREALQSDRDREYPVRDHSMPRNARSGGMGGRLAGDADLLAARAAMERVTPMPPRLPQRAPPAVDGAHMRRLSRMFPGIERIGTDAFGRR